MYSRNDELRKVDSKHLRRVYSALDSLDSWQVLMGRIPKNLVSKTFTPRYNKDHVKIIAEASKHRSPTEVLFDEWGTSGRIRPTVETLLDLLIEINMFRAADIVAKDLLGGDFKFLYMFIYLIYFSYRTSTKKTKRVPGNYYSSSTSKRFRRFC